MKNVMPWIVLVAAAVGAFLAGCDTVPSSPKVTTIDKPNTLPVTQDDEAEVKLAIGLETARINYAYRLEVLDGYYQQVGDADKYKATKNELKALNQAQNFKWDGLPEIVPPERESIANVDERLLVEYAIAARNEYQKAVNNLLALYEKDGRIARAALMRALKKRYDEVRASMYFFDAEIPGPDLRPTEVVPEADAMFNQAYKLFRRGKGLLYTFVTTDYQKERQALAMFRQLIAKYPRSTKIALSAYYIGDILKEYFNEDVRAVKWYERAWQWDANLPEPARFQAATVYDLRLKNPERAVELYNAAIQHEQFNKTNVTYARQRIKALTGE
jgi:TolA-binding protein